VIELDEDDIKLLREVEQANSTDYGIVEIKGKKYINSDDLLVCLEETQDYREYAEEKVKELCNSIEED